MIGKRGTGKSTIVADLMIRFQEEIDVATVINPTEEANHFYQKMFPKTIISTKISEDILIKARKYQQIKTNKYKQNPTGSRAPSMVIILDDCLYSDFWKRSETIKWLFFNGRHFNILLIITLQDPMGIPPDLRTNIDYVFILIENRDNNRKKIFSNYAGAAKSYKTFCKYMDKYTKNYGSIVVDNVTTETDTKKILFKFRGNALQTPPLMCPQLRQYISQKYG